MDLAVQHTRFCREINFVAIYALLDVPFSAPATRFCREISFVALLGVSFSAIHGDEWLFHDYGATVGLLTLAQGYQR